MDTAVKQADDKDYDHDHKHEHKHCHEHHGHSGHDHWREREQYEHIKWHHLHELETKIKALADQLAFLGRGKHLYELLRIIHRPGWTTQAELAFVNVILDNIGAQVRELDHLQADLVEAGRKVTYEYKYECRHEHEHRD